MLKIDEELKIFTDFTYKTKNPKLSQNDKWLREIFSQITVPDANVECEKQQQNDEKKYKSTTFPVKLQKRESALTDEWCYL